jgi:NAD(P)-dependent dehydrogenase (short-subunit alcohol dehydrogenase family)
LEWAGRCDILVNNASYTPAGGFLDIPVSRWRTGMAITVMAPVRLAQSFLPSMLAQGSGRVLNIGSAAGAYRTSPIEASPYPIADTPLLYCVTKAALERLTIGLHDTYSSSGISVNNLRAGQMATEAWHYMREKTGFHDPVESVHTPEEVANAGCWMLEQPPTFSGYILDFSELIRRGVLPARV